MLTPEELKPYAALSSGHVSDAMEWMGLRRSVIQGFKLLAEAEISVVGTAATVVQRPKRHPAEPTENRVRHAELARQSAPGSVLIIDVAGRMDVGSWGENQSLRAKAAGAAGVIVNGCTRDGRGIERLGLPTFCLGLSPIKSRWDLETVAFNEPVTIGRVQIHPGDVIFGDRDGIIVVPKDVCSAVFERALEIFQKEDVRKVSA